MSVFGAGASRVRRSSTLSSGLLAAGLPLGPGDLPVAEAVPDFELGAAAVLDDDDVAFLGDGLHPGGVFGGHVEAAVADVGVALLADGPGGGVVEDAAVGHPGGV